MRSELNHQRNLILSILQVQLNHLSTRKLTKLMKIIINQNFINTAVKTANFLIEECRQKWIIIRKLLVIMDSKQFAIYLQQKMALAMGWECLTEVWQRVSSNQAWNDPANICPLASPLFLVSKAK